ncbi:Rpn family recombination-promoting nuclease/putative transposase [Paenibacillus eucommiae]|uniref:Transposase/invertase (TIGR01784 family) n=1 Tax=Paenibacillus eucommiae TaxID=1355755 RepID=A0ABS4IRW7_9BACL|nr:Rpn family recombination-promoting nuclease/putative transposase [Paenibacillus eucommiae]MBP1990318.1 putative transposase/invertase (TIGR01784 family) [Paenibacillus eucommiae]
MAYKGANDGEQMQSNKEGQGIDQKIKKAPLPHDEAFKKLLQTFFAEFIALFFPELDRLLDHSHTRLLMQEQLVDIVGEEAKHLDLLLETKYTVLDAYVLIHFEPQSYKKKLFHERMFIYFSRLFERHRKEHKLIIPIAIFTSDQIRDEPDTLLMAIPEHDILRFQFLKVELRKQDWRRFMESDNPVAAALLAKMGYTKKEAREVRLAYLRMILRIRKKLDDARLALIMSVADIYFQPDREQDEAILLELSELYPEEGEAIMELMPAWKRWGYEEGIERGIEQGIEKGIEQGIEQGIEKGKEEIIRKFLNKGFSPAEIADTLELPVGEVLKLIKQ